MESTMVVVERVLFMFSLVATAPTSEINATLMATPTVSTLSPSPPLITRVFTLITQSLAQPT